MNKDEFKKKLGEFLSSGTIGVANKFPEKEENFAVVSSVEDFDPASNDMWDNEANKSYPRELHCSKCQRQVVMSDGMFKMYQEAEVKPTMICSTCLLDQLKQNG